MLPWESSLCSLWIGVLGVASTHARVEASYYHGVWLSLPNFDDLTPYATDSFHLIDSDTTSQADGMFTSGRGNNLGVVFRGMLRFPKAGPYTLYTFSDDGSQLFFDGILTVDNNGEHPAEEQSGDINIVEANARHQIRVDYFENTEEDTEILKVLWRGPGIGQYHLSMQQAKLKGN